MRSGKREETRQSVKDKTRAVPYRAFLVRAWQEETLLGRVTSWRFMLQEVQGQQRRWGFSRFDDMVKRLRAMLINNLPEGED
jgi:hypothetical protein